MTNTKDLSPDLATSVDARSVLTIEQRRFRRQVLETCFAQGRPVDRDVLTVVLAAKGQRDEPFMWWTPAVVRELLWVDVVNWCLLAAVDVPGNVPEVLWALVECVPVGTAERAALREPLSSEGGLAGDGTRRQAKRRHPSRRRVS